MAPLFEFLPRRTVILPQALIIEFDRYVHVVREGLRQEGDQHGVAPQRVHPLELWHCGLPAELCQPFHPIGIERGEIPGVDVGVEQKPDLPSRLAMDDRGDHTRTGVRMKIRQSPFVSIHIECEF